MTHDDTRPPERRIAIVTEDDSDLQRAICFLLEAEGYEVGLLRSAEALLVSSAGHAGCLIVDDSLPRRRGLTLLRTLRVGGSEIPAVLLVDDLDAGLLAVASEVRIEVVEKPFTGRRLLDAIQASTARPVLH